MALSGTDNYNLTRDQIIRAAFENVGVAIANEPLEAEDVAVAAVSLNTMALSWKSHGLQLWKRARYSITSATTPALVAGTAKYELGGTSGNFLKKPMRLLSVSTKDSNGDEVDLTKLALEEYEDLPNKTTQGVPINFYVEPQRLVTNLYLWPTPDATFISGSNTIEVVYQAAMEDMDVGNEDVDFPNEWYDALILNLSVRLAPKYGLPMQERELLEIQASAALDLAKDYDVEDGSVFFQPSNRGK